MKEYSFLNNSSTVMILDCENDYDFFNSESK